MQSIKKYAIWKLSLLLVFLSTQAFAQNITIHQFDPTVNVSSNFGMGVTTFTLTVPMAAGVLSGPDLDAALALGNVVINTPNGDVIFTSSGFILTAPGSTLTINALGNVTLINYVPVTANLINIFANAGGNLTVTGTGFKTGGGNFTADIGGSVNIMSDGLNTGGGNINITADGVFFQSGVGLVTNGGNFTANVGGNFTLSEGGLKTNGGNIDLTVTGNFMQTGTQLTTTGGNFTAEVGGTTTFGFGGTMNTGGGDLTIHTIGAFIHQGASFVTQGGNIDFSGASLTSTGLDTRTPATTIPAGSILLDFTGNITVSGPGIYGGEIEIFCNDLLCTNTGIQSFGTNAGQDGSVRIEALGNVVYQGAAGQSNGDVEIISNNLTLVNGLLTNGGDITFCQTGDVNLTGFGLRTLDPSAQVSLFGNVNISAGGYVSVRNGAGIYTGLAFFVGGGTTNSDGGDVNVRADSIYLYGGSINTGMRRANYLGGGSFANGYLITGATGTLTTLPAIGTPSSILVQNFSQITSMVASYPSNLIPADQNMRFLGPYLGGGNVTLDVQSEMVACIVEPPIEPIPTIGTWAFIILSLSLVILGQVYIRPQTTASIS